MTIDKAKALFVALGAALSSWLGLLATPVYILVLLNIIDYFTGIIAAPGRGEARNSYKGVQGIAKKICILLLVALAAIVDWLLLYAAEFLGLRLPFTFTVACLTAVWLICNELLSILENIGDIGAPLPPFLAKAVKWVKQSAEEKER